MHHNFKALSKKEYIGIATKTDKRHSSPFPLFGRSGKKKGPQTTYSILLGEWNSVEERQLATSLELVS